MAKRITKVSAVLVFCALAVSFTSEARAYSLIGQRMTQDPYHLYYWDGGVTTNLAGFNAQNSTDLAMTAWNNTPNTKIWMYKTTDQVASVMDFHSEFNGDSNILGWTVFYNGNTMVDPTVSQWSWAQSHINTNGNIDWMHDPTTGEYHDANGKQQAILAHEAGYGFGLDHIGEYSWTANRLMLPTPSSYYGYGTKGPTDDEVSGVQAIYGTLY